MFFLVRQTNEVTWYQADHLIIHFLNGRVAVTACTLELWKNRQTNRQRIAFCFFRRSATGWPLLAS